ncbi:hypothetical protein HCI99_13120 [Listeria booriae]|uniref:Lantibiotic dehydratase N-terminal domain-containing protein n=1 Tax=Listeria booriae TaxID=1552123 RepID=A0A7X0XEJ6_9LIST|nr:hypothetical protein [Listeria booriae]MBC1492759.1 hypothetical protein [Listeria booriae]
MTKMNYNPYILIRKNTLRKDSIEHINSGEAYDFVENLQLKRMQYKKIIQIMINLLEQQIGENYDNRYLNLKRAIFNNRINKASKLITELLNENFDEHIKEIYGDYLSCSKQYQTDEKSIDLFYKNSLERARKSLYHFANKTEIQEYLMMIQPSIYEKLASYLENDTSNHRNKEKKLDGTLYKVASRAALKTSPFANITKVGRIVFEKESCEVNIPKCVENDNKYVKINFTYLNRVAFSYLYQSNKFYKEVQYKTPPLSIKKTSAFHYVSFVATKDDINSSKIFETSEILKTLKIIPELSKFLDLNNVRNTINFEQFNSILSNYITESEAFDLLKKYVEIGLLIPAVGFKARTDIELCTEIIHTCKKFLSDEISNDQKKFINQVLDTKEKLSACNSLIKRKQIYQDFQKIINRNPKISSIKMSINNIFYEDGVIKEPTIKSDLLTNQQLEDLKLIQTFTLLFDVNVRMRLELGEILNIKEIHTLNNDFFTVLFDTSKKILPYWSSPYYSANNLHSKYIGVLDQLKLSFLKEYTDFVEKQKGQEEIDITSIIKKYQSLIPEELIQEVDLSTSYFFQKHNSQIILNNIYDGQEKYKARFMDYFDEYLEFNPTYKKYVNDYYLDQNYIEYTETFGFNGNVKKTELPRKAMTIGTGRKRFTLVEEDVVRVEDLNIVSSKKTHMINFTTENKERVNIVFRGSLIPTAMPGYISTLMQLFSSGRMTFKFSDLVKFENLPRLKFNDIVLARKKESLSMYAIYFYSSKKDTEAQFYYKVLTLCWEKKVPSNFFVVAKRDLSSGELKFIDFKPFYVDLLNPISVKQFLKEIIWKYKDEEYEDLFLEETLSSSGVFAEEYDLELYKKEGTIND